MTPSLSFSTPEPVLAIDDLHVRFPTDDGVVKAAAGVSFEVFEDEVVGVVGESGSGKTVTALAILGLLPRSAEVGGSVKFRGRELLGAPEKELRTFRGSRVALVFQDALAALNPLHRVGRQISEAISIHHPGVRRRDLDDRVVELLKLVGIPNAKERSRQYPHEFSGGMRQRAMIAMAFANNPDVLIADEPTTALDVTTQAQVLEVLDRAREQSRSAMILITHNLGVVAGVADRVLVMYAGRIVESGTVEQVFANPEHPYTQGLLASLPRLDRQSRRLERIPGQPPSLIDVPPGCPFHPRCRFAQLPEPCASAVPEPRSVSSPQHRSACHFAGDVSLITPEGVSSPPAS